MATKLIKPPCAKCGRTNYTGAAYSHEGKWLCSTHWEQYLRDLKALTDAKAKA